MNNAIDISPAERRLLSALKKRPEMYLRTKCLTNFSAWLCGYQSAIRAKGLPWKEDCIVPDGDISIHDFAAEKLGGDKQSTCGWISYILAYEPDDKKAFDVCFELLDKYLMFLGFEPIPDWDGEQKRFYTEIFGE